MRSKLPETQGITPFWISLSFTTWHCIMIGHNHLGKNGRFGNQMFQYAATRGIAAKHNYDWCIPDGPKTDDEFEDEENQHKLFMAFKMDGAKKINMHPAPYKQEGSFTFDQDLFDNCEDNVNLYGYFLM